MKPYVGLFLIIFSLTACGKKSTKLEDTAKFGAQKYRILDSGNLREKEGSIEGTGSVVFESTLGGSQSNVGYLIEFEFLGEDGSLFLFSHADGNLKKGAGVIYAQTRNEVELTFFVQIFGQIAKSISVPTEKKRTLYVDILNGESPTRILAWNKSGDFSADHALADSLTFKEPLEGRGTGSNWGIKLQSAKVTKIQTTAHHLNTK